MITIYSADYCSHCKRAKLLLNKLNISYVEYDIDKLSNQLHLDDLMIKTIGKSKYTIPQIWNGQEYIGGADELEKYFKGE